MISFKCALINEIPGSLTVNARGVLIKLNLRSTPTPSCVQNVEQDFFFQTILWTTRLRGHVSAVMQKYLPHMLYLWVMSFFKKSKKCMKIGGKTTLPEIAHKIKTVINRGK